MNNWKAPDVSAMRIYERIVCRDGATVSIQANRGMYCTPRQDAGPYTHVEAGFPSVQPPESWKEYMDGGDDPLDTVYGYVPVAHIKEFIDAHGGIVSGELPPFVEGVA